MARECSDAPSHLLGHSFGGLVAQTAAVDNTPAWRSLSLLCSGPGALGESAERPLGRLIRALGKVPLIDIHHFRENGAVRVPDENVRHTAAFEHLK